jgi:S1-C subfamily serine protease
MAPEGEDREEWNPIGQPISYRVQDDEHVHDALILSYSLTADLAIIDARPPVTPVVASLSQDPIEVGTWVDIIGHPIGYEWSYARGWVSAYRPFERNTHRLPMLTLQVAGPISPGNSGGGAFDASGRLVGIASYMDVRLNGMAFFVHRDAIRQFLKENGIS